MTSTFHTLSALAHIFSTVYCTEVTLWVLFFSIKKYRYAGISDTSPCKSDPFQNGAGVSVPEWIYNKVWRYRLRRKHDLKFNITACTKPCDSAALCTVSGKPRGQREFYSCLENTRGEGSVVWEKWIRRVCVWLLDREEPTRWDFKADCRLTSKTQTNTVNQSNDPWPPRRWARAGKSTSLRWSALPQEADLWWELPGSAPSSIQRPGVWNAERIQVVTWGSSASLNMTFIRDHITMKLKSTQFSENVHKIEQRQTLQWHSCSGNTGVWWK